MSLNRSLVWHCHSDSKKAPSERKSFSACDGYQRMGGGGREEAEGDWVFSCQNQRHEETDVGLCLGNGPWLILLALFGIGKWTKKNGDSKKTDRRWKSLKIPVLLSCLVMNVFMHNPHYNPTMSVVIDSCCSTSVSPHYLLNDLPTRHSCVENTWQPSCFFLLYLQEGLLSLLGAD